ncbi:MAG: hypothetical protein H0W33_00260 [Gammaproteobacteria bacterium]|nr:hypothetical protein [Gammaproteobacteria bacterium]
MSAARPELEFPFLSWLGAADPRLAGWSWRLIWIPILLVCADLALIGLDVSRISFGFPVGWQFRVANDRSYGELLQYCKELGIGLAFLLLCWRRQSGIYAVWSALFLLFLADDALKLHEAGGSIFSHSFGVDPRWGLRAQDLGELAVTAPAFAAFLVTFVWFYRMADGRARSLSRAMLVLLAGLVFFGVFGDMLHSWMSSHRELFAVFEDGGEMLAMSALATLVYFELVGAPWRRLVRVDAHSSLKHPGDSH